MIFSLENKIAIITGAGSGIGKAMALLFAQQKAIVYVLDFNIIAAQEVASEITSKNGKAFAVEVDVTNQTLVIDVINKIGNANSKIDILINNAGIAHIGNAENTNESDFNKVMQVNVNGVYNCIHATIPFMTNKGGAILNLASIASSVGLLDRFVYSTSKGAIVGITLSVAKDFISKGIRCNCISPARVHTPFVDGFLQKYYPSNKEEMFEKLSKSQPIGRMALPEEIAFLALYLCSDEASFITGCDYPIDGGFIKLNN
jgi:2-keto-3-deoxy-L-fuconate dehydrogenase